MAQLEVVVCVILAGQGGLGGRLAPSPDQPLGAPQDLVTQCPPHAEDFGLCFFEGMYGDPCSQVS